MQQIKVTLLSNETDGTQYRVYETYDIPYSLCELGRNIFYDNKAEIEKFYIESYYCADWQNLTI